MNIVEIEIKSIRLNSKNSKMLGNVTFHVSGGTGDRCDIMNFECCCDIPKGDNSELQLPQIEHSLKIDAMRQAKRMPEFRSGEDHLTFLAPQEREIA